MPREIDRVKLWQFILTVGITLCGVAASWGSTKAQLTDNQKVLANNQLTIEGIDTDIEKLKIDGAVRDEALRNIDKKLDTIQRDLDKLNDKMDKLKK